MVNKEVLTYISAEMDRGTLRETIEKNLKDNGWDTNDLKEAFALVTNVNAEVPASASFKNAPVAQAPASVSISPSMSRPSPIISSPGLESAEISALSNASFNSMGSINSLATKMADVNPAAGEVNPNIGMSQAKSMASQFAQASKPLPNFSGMSMSGVNPSPAQNFASVKPTVQQTVKSGGVMGYVWTALIFLLLGAGGGFYASRTLFPATQPVVDYVAPSAQVNTPVQGIRAELPPVLPASEIATSTATTTPNQSVCAQVITKAKDPKTKIIKEFPTSCDVPAGWEVILPTSTSTSASPITKPKTQ